MHLPELVAEDLSVIHTSVLLRSLRQYLNLLDALKAARLSSQTSVKARVEEATERISRELLHRGIDLPSLFAAR